MPRGRRLLLVRLGAFGDIIHTLPLAADLAAGGWSVEWVCEDRWADLLRGSPVVDRVHELPRGSWRREARSPGGRFGDLRRLARGLRRRGFQASIDAHGLAKSAAVVAAVGAPVRVGHVAGRSREGAWCLSNRRVPVPARHVIDHQRALALALDVRPQGGWRFPLPPWPAARAWAASWLAERGLERPCVLNVGAGWPTKVWPERCQAEFLRQILAGGRPALVVWGTRAEASLAARLQADLPQLIVAPATDLPHLAGLLASAGVVVSGDTGPLHLAFALGTPTVGLFGPVPAERNGPRGPRHRTFQAPGMSWTKWERQRIERVDMGAIVPEVVVAAVTDIARS